MSTGTWTVTTISVLVYGPTPAVALGSGSMLSDSEGTFCSDAAMHESVPAIAAVGASPLVRIPDRQGWMIKRKVLTPKHFLGEEKVCQLTGGDFRSS